MGDNNRKIVEKVIKDCSSHVRTRVFLDKYETLVEAIERQSIKKIRKEVLEMITEGISYEQRAALDVKLLHYGYWYDSSKFSYILIRRIEGILCEKTTQF